MKHFLSWIFPFFFFFLNYNPLSLDSRPEFEPIAKSQWFIKFMTQLYLYTAWRTPLFHLVSWGRTESLEEKQLPREREERPPVASGTKWGHVLWRRGPERFLKKLTTGVLYFPFCITFGFNVPLWELGLRVQPLSSSVGKWTEIESPAVGTQHLWRKFARHTPSPTRVSPHPWWPHPFSNHSQPSAMVATLSICVERGFPLRPKRGQLPLSFLLLSLQLSFDLLWVLHGV